MKTFIWAQAMQLAKMHLKSCNLKRKDKKSWQIKSWLSDEVVLKRTICAGKIKFA